MKYEYNKRKYIRIQRLVNIRTAKAYRTTSNEAVCIITGITPIIIKADEAVRLYNARKIRGSQTQEIDYVVEYKNWPHPADGAIMIEEEESRDSTVLAYTDGSQSELGVGPGTVIFIGNEIATQIKSRLASKCSNNQAEQITTINALEAVATLNIPENRPRTAMVYTDSRITLDFLQNHRIHAHLIDEMRKRIATLKKANWKITFTWVKAHVGIPGNEMADKLAKEAARNRLIDINFSRVPISSVNHDIQTDSIKIRQKEWQNCNKALTTKKFFPSIEKRLKKDQNYSKRYSYVDRTWEDKGLPSLFQDKGQGSLCLPTRRPDGRSSSLRLHPSRNPKRDPKKKRNKIKQDASFYE
jgi:ribonuclease HI